MNVTKQPAVRLIVVEDHPIMLMGISALLTQHDGIQIVAGARSGEEAIELYLRHKPDVILMDLQLPGISGVEAIVHIRSRHPTARVVVLTTYEGDEDIYQALKAGASGYVIKGMPQQMLLDAVQAVSAGKQFIPPSIKSALDSRGGAAGLTSRERDVLVRIAEGKSNKEIAAELGLAEITVKCRVSVIFLRLNVTDRTQAVVVAIQRGLLHL